MKKVLIVDDDPEWLYDTYEPMLKHLGCEHSLVNFQYAPLDIPRLPTERFDIAIIDGLKGSWSEVGRRVNAGRKVLSTFNDEYLSECRKGHPSIEAFGKVSVLDLERLVKGEM